MSERGKRIVEWACHIVLMPVSIPLSVLGLFIFLLYLIFYSVGFVINCAGEGYDVAVHKWKENL